MTLNPQEKLAYPADDYDDHFCLKPGLVLRLVWANLTRSFFFALAVYSPFVRENAHFFTVGIENMGAYIACSVPSMLLLLIYFRRGPTSGRISRLLWRYGWIMLFISAIGYLTLESNIDPSWDLSFIFTTVDLLCIVYLVAARRVRAFFGDFPPHSDGLK